MADDTSMADSTTGDETTGGETTGEDLPDGNARFIVGERVLTETDNLTRPHLLTYAQGGVVSLVELVPELPENASVIWADVVDQGLTLVYCTAAPGDAAHPCEVRDLRSDPPGPATSLAVTPVPAGATLQYPEWVASTSSFLFSAATLDGSASGIYLAPAADGIVGAPVPLVVSGPGERVSSGFSVDHDGSRIGYLRMPEGGPPEAWIAPANPPDPMTAVRISAPVDPMQQLHVPQFVPGLDAMIYVVDSDEPANPLALSLWLVDVSTPMPGTPVRLDDPLAAPLQIRRPSIASDGHALVYYLGAEGELMGELMLVDLGGGAPAPPIRVSTPSDSGVEVTDWGWSPDGRWIAYMGRHEGPEQTDVYVVDASSTPPGDPVRVSEGLIDGGEMMIWRFDADGHWLYMFGQIDAERPGLFRVDVSGDTPGAPERVGDPATWADEELVFSSTGTKLLHAAFSGSPSVRQLALADVSGAEVGVSTIINDALGRDVDVGYGPQFSRDESVVAYRESGPGFDAPQLLHLVDLTTLDVVEVDIDTKWITAAADLP
ncbi:MAG: PD40 domain-containing protein [Myxococcales bacterium]|nr:PD40 domain-containing protein [Myxococcales bacterium]